jgi:hypothetical protein
VRARRDAIEAELARIATASPNPGRDATLLIDAMWDNPNYWLRLTTVRAALGSAKAREVGLIGVHRQSEVSRTLENLGIAQTVRWKDLAPRRAEVRTEAATLCRELRAPEDILDWQLPYGFPAEIVYDGILKRQRAACVDIGTTTFQSHVEDALIAIETADRIVEDIGPDHVIVSHAINFDFGALAWAAIRRGIATTLIFGMFGGARFIKLTRPQDLFDLMDFPEGEDLDSLPPDVAASLADRGRRNLEARFSGATSDIGAQFAFGVPSTAIDRDGLRRELGWSDDMPVIAVYAANWFDYPHYFGMRNFRDFLDWLETTIEGAKDNPGVGWLLKPHPCDAWYGGVTMADLAGEAKVPNIALVPDAWSSSDLLASVDGLVTVHSTGAVEAAALGKPVLVADRGWYHECGFVHWAQSRDAYMKALASPWWEAIDTEVMTFRARVFAGLYFGRPGWQGDFITEDDSKQDAIYDTMPALLESNAAAIDREIATLRDWFAGPKRRYHTFKMLREANSVAA